MFNTSYLVCNMYDRYEYEHEQERNDDHERFQDYEGDAMPYDDYEDDDYPDYDNGYDSVEYDEREDLGWDGGYED